MLLNKDSKPWALTAGAIFVACALTYIPYHRSQLAGPSGGTWPGLIYGVIGTAFILLAIGLTPRKKFRTLRVGRVYWWMQAHVWFGLLAFPVICFHAGFRHDLWGGPLTWALMLLFIAIELSGILGLILQNILPGKLLRDVQFETIFEQIDHVREKLLEEATAKVATVTARRAEREFDVDAVPAGASASALATLAAPASPGVGTSDVNELSTFFTQQVRPVLSAAAAPANLATAPDFDRLRSRTPLFLHDTINDLQSIVEERRQLDRQRRLHTFLHAWLWVHIPLSFAMLVLICVHAVQALRYAHPW